MISSKLIQRINQELLWLQECPLISAKPHEDNILVWDAVIHGPPDTAFQGGIFKLKIHLPYRYPFFQPRVEFLTEIFHPNIHKTAICVDILQDNWSAVLNISKVLYSIMSLLTDPNPDSPLNKEAADLYKIDKEKYNEKVKEYVTKYAMNE